MRKQPSHPMSHFSAKAPRLLGDPVAPGGPLPCGEGGLGASTLGWHSAPPGTSSLLPVMEAAQEVQALTARAWSRVELARNPDLSPKWPSIALVSAAPPSLLSVSAPRFVLPHHSWCLWLPDSPGHDPGSVEMRMLRWSGRGEKTQAGPSLPALDASYHCCSHSRH